MEEKVTVSEGKSTNCKNFRNFKVYFSLENTTHTKRNKKEKKPVCCIELFGMVFIKLSKTSQ